MSDLNTILASRVQLSVGRVTLTNILYIYMLVLVGYRLYI